MTANPPPGWYPDTRVPGGKIYWDGNAWVAPAPPVPLDATIEQGTPPTGQGIPRSASQAAGQGSAAPARPEATWRRKEAQRAAESEPGAPTPERPTVGESVAPDAKPAPLPVKPVSAPVLVTMGVVIAIVAVVAIWLQQTYGGGNTGGGSIWAYQPRPDDITCTADVEPGMSFCTVILGFKNVSNQPQEDDGTAYMVANGSIYARSTGDSGSYSGVEFNPGENMADGGFFSVPCNAHITEIFDALSPSETHVWDAIVDARASC